MPYEDLTDEKEEKEDLTERAEELYLKSKQRQKVTQPEIWVPHDGNVLMTSLLMLWGIYI